MPSRPLCAFVFTLFLMGVSGCAVVDRVSGPATNEYNFIDSFQESEQSADEDPVTPELALVNHESTLSETSANGASSVVTGAPIAIEPKPRHGNVLETLIQDQANFYSRDHLCLLVPVLGTSAVFAHSSFDEEFAATWQEDIRSDFTDDIAEFSKQFGEQWAVVPVYVTASLIGRTPWCDHRVQVWGERSFRSMLVGVPPLLLAQRAIGSSRPNDALPSSHWHLWNDNNGASGHTFVGAVPFMVAAQLAERDVCRASLYAASTLTGLSRINDNDHFASQVVMGWFIAFAATKSTQQTDECGVKIFPLRIGNKQIGLGFDKRF